MSALISVIVRTAYRRRALVAAGVLVVVLLSLEGVRRLSFDADVLSLLPRDSRVIQSFQTFLTRFGSLDQLYVLFTAPEGHAIAEYSDEIDAWINGLRSAPEISRVDAGVADSGRDFGWLADRQLLVLRDRFLDDALKRLSPGGMSAAIAARRELLTMPSARITDLVRQDPLGLFDLLRETVGGAQGGVNIGIGTDGYVTSDDRRRLLMARPKRPPYDTVFSRALDTRLNEIKASVARRTADPKESQDEEPSPPMTVQFAGGHRIAVETEAVVRQESLFNTFGSLLLILPLLFVVFRSAWLVTIGALPSLLSLVVVLGVFGLTGAKLSAAGTGAAAMMFGLGVDGVVLLYVAHRQALAHDADVSVPQAIAAPSASMLLGMWTTAATFYGLMFVDFPSLQQLGRLLGHSMVVCGILTLLLVPALLPRRPRPRAALFMPGFAAWITRRRRVVIAGSVVLTLALGVAATRMRIDPSLNRLRSVTPAARLEAEIASSFGLPNDVYVVLAEGPQLEPLLETNERLSDRLSSGMPGLALQPPAWILPSAASQTRRLQAIGNAKLSPDKVHASLERARAAADFKPGAFDPFAARLSRLIDPPGPLTYDGYVAHGLRDVIDRFIVREGDVWTLATYVFPSGPEQVAGVQAIVDQVDPSQSFTGLTLVNRELARSFVPQFMKGLTIGTLLVVLLVVAAFRNWRLSMYALLPTAIGLTWAAGVLAIGGAELDLFAVFAVVTFVGIGVDYGVHLVHRYHDCGDAVRATGELAPVILVAAAITMLGYGTLITSSYPPLRSIGVVSLASTIALTATSVLLLPAMLVSDGKRRER